jgi:hypothetical protein
MALSELFKHAIEHFFEISRQLLWFSDNLSLYNVEFYGKAHVCALSKKSPPLSNMILLVL